MRLGIVIVMTSIEAASAMPAGKKKMIAGFRKVAAMIDPSLMDGVSRGEPSDQCLRGGYSRGNWRRRSLQRRADFGEFAAHCGAERRQGADEKHGDQSGDQTVFNRGRAGFVTK